MRYRHTMVRVSNLEASLDFYCNKLGLVETRRIERPEQKYTLVFLAAPEDEQRAKTEKVCELELTYNYGPEEYGSARNFGHIAFEVDNLYEVCQRLVDAGITLNRPPRDGHCAFIRSPDMISIEILQKTRPLEPKEPWKSMPNVGTW
jgi:lactoylglutathione lyase